MQSAVKCLYQTAILMRARILMKAVLAKLISLNSDKGLHPEKQFRLARLTRPDEGYIAGLSHHA